ncbi:tyrosine-type recombinase/integrase [Streptomyces griseorubiginosus]|uniref:tyrosine-type recombinase/integrase n=1 Tax=Streptomyces griseorubiginosus TaxID=67304 RepID=UPI000AEBEEBF|nr:tyrosine-type recombinase/integrase [Streptomyces griseorubiginosus]
MLRLVHSVGDECGEGPAGFEGELVDRFVLAGMGAGISDRSLADDRSVVGDLVRSTGRRVWEIGAQDVDGWLASLRQERHLARSTVYDRANTIARFYNFLTLRYQREIHARTGWVVVQPVDEFNRPRHAGYGLVRVPPSVGEVEALFEGWRRELPGARKYLPAVRNYVVASLWRRVGLRLNESVMLDVGDWHPDLGRFGKLHVRYGKGSQGQGPRPRLVPGIDGVDVLLRWWLAEVRPQFPGDPADPGAPLFPGERRSAGGRVGAQALRSGLAGAVERFLPAWAGRLSPHGLRHFCASSLYGRGVDLKAIQELLGHEWLATTTGYIHVRTEHIEQAWARANERVAGRLSLDAGRGC